MNATLISQSIIRFDETSTNVNIHKQYLQNNSNLRIIALSSKISKLPSPLRHEHDKSDNC